MLILLLAMFFSRRCFIFSINLAALKTAFNFSADDLFQIQNQQSKKYTFIGLPVSASRKKIKIYPIKTVSFLFIVIFLKRIMQLLRYQKPQILLLAIFAEAIINLKIINQKVTVLKKARKQGNSLLLKDKINL